MFGDIYISTLTYNRDMICNITSLCIIGAVHQVYINKETLDLVFIFHIK